jgi:hypothetical protein
MDHFSFYQYSIDAADHEERKSTAGATDGTLSAWGMEQSYSLTCPRREEDDLKRVVFC